MASQKVKEITDGLTMFAVGAGGAIISSWLVNFTPGVKTANPLTRSAAQFGLGLVGGQLLGLGLVRGQLLGLGLVRGQLLGLGLVRPAETGLPLGLWLLHDPSRRPGRKTGPHLSQIFPSGKIRDKEGRS